MPNDSYEHDILSWSERQADLLRRVANGERVNEVDWPHVIEEIADVGLSELHAVRSFLRQAMVHLLKAHLAPQDPARDHWLAEIDTFLDDAQLRFAPSMRQRIDLDALFLKAARRATRQTPGRTIQETCPWTLEALLAGDTDALLATLAAPPSAPQTA